MAGTRFPGLVADGLWDIDWVRDALRGQNWPGAIPSGEATWKLTPARTNGAALQLQTRSGQTYPLFEMLDLLNARTMGIFENGRITDALWQGQTIQPPYGGTGLSSLGSALQVLRTNAGASAMEWATISSGSATGMFATTDTEKTASYTATANQLAPINLSSVGSDVTASAPATPAAGDWFGYYVSGANLNNKATLGRNGNTVIGSTSVSAFDLSAVGDYAVWRYLSSTWVPVDFRGTSLFFPSSITGCQLWLDASSASTLFDATSGGSAVAAGGAVARWEDRSGNARHATQSTSGARPIRLTNQLNGRDGLDFDGTDDTLRVDSLSSFFSGTNKILTVFAVAQTDATGSTQDLISAGQTANNDQNYRFVWNNGSQKAQIARQADGAGSSVFVTGGTNLGTTARLVQWQFDGTNGTLWVNGSSDAPNTNITATSTLNAVAIGSLPRLTPAVFLNGRIYEIVVYNSVLSSANRLLVENYLRAKWNV